MLSRSGLDHFLCGPLYGLPSYFESFHSGEGILFDAKISAKSRTDIDCDGRLTLFGTGWYTHDAAGFEKHG